jgi:hypothetical protein
MLAYLVRLLVFAVVAFTTLSSSADWLSCFCNSIARDTKRRNCWPAPFVCPDRQTVRAPFCIEVTNGWRRQNMLSDFHFESKTGQLTEAGKLKIRWVFFECPEQHRGIFVHIGQTTEETDARMAAVNAYANTLASQGPVPPIMSTAIPDDGYSAAQVDMITRKYQSSVPPPRLPSQSGQSSGNGSSGQQ